MGKEVFKFPLSVVQDMAQSEEDKIVDDSFVTSDMSSDAYAGFHNKYMKEDEKTDAMPWCKFSDFCKYHKDGRGFNLNDVFKKANWHVFVKQKALHIIHEVEKFQTRNRNRAESLKNLNMSP